MKKIFILGFLIFIIKINYAQERDRVGHIVGNWCATQRMDCYKGIAWKVRRNYYSDDMKDYINEYEITNMYNTIVTFSYELGEKPDMPTQFRISLRPGESYTNMRCKNKEYVFLHVDYVCFNNQNCNDNCYALCDNGTPNQPNCNTQNQSTSNATNTNQTTVNTNTTSGEINVSSVRYHNCPNATYDGVPSGYFRCGCCGDIVSSNLKMPDNCNLGGQTCGPCTNNLNSNTAVSTNTIANQNTATKPNNTTDPNVQLTNDITNIVNTTAPLIIQGIENMQRFKLEEKELLKKLKGNEAKYQEAISYYNNFVKYKKRANRVAWSGVGVTGVGLGLIVASIIPTYPNMTLLYAGTGITLVGAGVSIGSIPIAMKSKNNFIEAKNLVANFSLKSNGLNIALNF